jgi:hypothetical protein
MTRCWEKRIPSEAICHHNSSSSRGSHFLWVDSTSVYIQQGYSQFCS